MVQESTGGAPNSRGFYKIVQYVKQWREYVAREECCLCRKEITFFLKKTNFVLENVDVN